METWPPCSWCAEPITDAQRSTRAYCGERCKQAAKRARERAARLDRTYGELRPVCVRCGGPLFPGEPTRQSKAGRSGQERIYCTPECRRTEAKWRAAARRYRVAKGTPEDGYRVEGDLGGVIWAGEMLACGHTTQWHDTAAKVMELVEAERLVWAPEFGPFVSEFTDDDDGTVPVTPEPAILADLTRRTVANIRRRAEFDRSDEPYLGVRPEEI